MHSVSTLCSSQYSSFIRFWDSPVCCHRCLTQRLARDLCDGMVLTCFWRALERKKKNVTAVAQEPVLTKVRLKSQIQIFLCNTTVFTLLNKLRLHIIHLLNMASVTTSAASLVKELLFSNFCTYVDTEEKEFKDTCLKRACVFTRVCFYTLCKSSFSNVPTVLINLQVTTEIKMQQWLL